MESPAEFVRVAIVVPKHGFSAVRRNRLKRQLRELTRLKVLPSSARRDVLLRARREAYAASFDQLRADVDGLARTLETAAG